MEQLTRLFLGVRLTEEVRAMLAQHLRGRRLPGQSIPPDNWHLTVRFLGTLGVVAGEQLVAWLDQADLGPAFDVTLGEMGAFPRPARASVLWLGIARGRERLNQLKEVAEEAAQAAGLAAEERPFAPHLTLSRIRPELDVRPTLDAYSPVPFGWRVTALTLFESHLGRGVARYKPVEEFPLARD